MKTFALFLLIAVAVSTRALAGAVEVKGSGVTNDGSNLPFSFDFVVTSNAVLTLNGSTAEYLDASGFATETVGGEVASQNETELSVDFDAQGDIESFNISGINPPQDGNGDISFVASIPDLKLSVVPEDVTDLPLSQIESSPNFGFESSDLFVFGLPTSVTVTVTTPEPSSWILFALGLVLVVVTGRRHRSA